MEAQFPSKISQAPCGVQGAQKCKTEHISVCVCTYKRPDMLRRLLAELNRQKTEGLFTFSIVVTDNDALRSAEPVVSECATSSPIPIRYCVEPEQNIALARNRALKNAGGGYVAFIDDDEFPIDRWLVTLFTTCNGYDVDGVLGPVRRHFDEQPPDWVIKGNFYERPVYPTGSVVDWRDGRTGNLLLKRAFLEEGNEGFRREFTGGEDTDFFRRMTQKGYTFIWSSEAVVYEVVPPERWSRSYLLRRALFRGSISLLHPTFGLRDVAKSLIAVPSYSLLLPFALLIGQHNFMNLLVRLFDHLGRLLALVGMNRVNDRYEIEQ